MEGRQKNKISLTIASEDSQENAFAVVHGFKKGMQLASLLGYDGVELALRDVGELDIDQLAQWLDDYQLSVSCINTGQLFSVDHFEFTHASDFQPALYQRFAELIDLAAIHSKKVNIGRVRGNIVAGGKEKSIQEFVGFTRQLCAYAKQKDVMLLLEPVNHTEIDFINTLAQGAEIIQEVGSDNLKLMPDLYHMSREETDLVEALDTYFEHIGYLHFADSNRLAPGKGQTNFEPVMKVLEERKYPGWINVEILPQPSPEQASKDAIMFLKGLLNF